jgi:DNA-binding NarL/FixJ family response regulator
MGRLRVYVADWQVLFRKGIRFTLSSVEDIEVVDDTGSNEEALKYIESNLPDIAIINTNDGNPGGIQITRIIKQNLPSVAVIMVMDYENDDHLFAAMKCGASACISKDIEPEHLVSVIKDVAGGTKPIIEALLKATLARRVLGVEGIQTKLSVDEVDILTHVAKGTSSEQTATAPGMSEGLLNTRLVSILSKLVANENELFSREQLFKKPGTDSFRWWGTPYKGGIRWTPIKNGVILDAVEEPAAGLRETVARLKAPEEAATELTIASNTEQKGEATPSPEVPEPVTPAVRETVKPAEMKKIIWVDRDLTSSVEFARVLRIAGFEVMAFADPDEGLQKLNEASLVVLDDELSSAGQVCSRIRNQSSVPVIIISSEKSGEVRDRAQVASANVYLSRTISGRELVARIRSVLRRC